MSITSRGTVDGDPVEISFSDQCLEWTYIATPSKPSRSVLASSIIAVIPWVGEAAVPENVLVYISKDEIHEERMCVKSFRILGLPQFILEKYGRQTSPQHLQISPPTDIHVVISTRSGTQLAAPFYEYALKPLLALINVKDYQVSETQSTETILELANTIFVPRARAGFAQTIILLSGDGGLIDLIKGFSELPETSTFVQPVVCLLPMGTGNATANSSGLLSDSTFGLSGLLMGLPKTLPVLQVKVPTDSMYVTDEGRKRESVAVATTATTATEASRNKHEAVIYGAVVVSWGIHASLVADSDTAAYRKFGVARFTIAAKELLYPSDGSESHQYKGRITLVERNASSGQQEERELEGELHKYVLMTLVSQLEKGFCISPESKPLDGQLRIVHFGPIMSDQAMQFMGLAYQGGKHVSEPEVTYQAVEAVRIRLTEEGDERWRRICVDGKIVVLPAGGWLEVRRSPRELLKLINTSPTPLRAAYLHGPYVLHVSCRPSTFDPNHKFESHETDGVPQFEPNLKPGGVWDAVIQVPERTRSSSAEHSTPSKGLPSVTWIIEITSEIIFSSSAAVHYEVVIGRDSNSTELGASTLANLPPAGQLQEHFSYRSKRLSKTSKRTKNTPGVYSDSVKLQVEDTDSLWNLPNFPSPPENKNGFSDASIATQPQSANVTGNSPSCDGNEQPKKRIKKIHFVVITHGLHSNIGADMLYLKESIDASAKQARKESKEQRKKARKVLEEQSQETPTSSFAKSSPGDDGDSDDDDDDDEEQVIVRGFPGNVSRTERGIQYLGKRLAKYVQLMTYPDQPYLPIQKTPNKLHRPPPKQSSGEDPNVQATRSGKPDPLQERRKHDDHGYRITSISFIGHSLGGLVQTYAIAYLQKHYPDFFDYIKPINFVALASPFLGLSNESPMYVKFALEFGVVGRTGQDLGLAWNTPSKVRSGWEAMIGGRGNDSQAPQIQPDPGSKPLLRVLPSGTAHQVLKKFRNRTLYSNVVNDGIVPLRTSCLLFLDWKGLERVEKARRENGFVGTMAEWGWAQLTGVNSSAMRAGRHTDSGNEDSNEDSGKTTPVLNQAANSRDSPSPNQFLRRSNAQSSDTELSPSSPTPSSPSTNGFFSFFKFQTRKDKAAKIYKRGQTVHVNPSDGPNSNSNEPPPILDKGRMRSNSLYEEEGVYAPPKTSLWESAGNLLVPPLPPLEYFLDPSTRERTIFHDRVYHPEDIPPPPPGRPRTIFRSPSHNLISTPENPLEQGPASTPASPTSLKNASNSFSKPSSGMRVEEKIARAYHRDLTWRKVLVRLQPDAHNNIIVRRMFGNAYGWPVVKHLVDTHFGYTVAAEESDEVEARGDRAKPMHQPANEEGEEVIGQADTPSRRTKPHETPLDHLGVNVPTDAVPELHDLTGSPQISRIASGNPQTESNPVLRHTMSDLSIESSRSKTSCPDSVQWTDTYFEDQGDDEFIAESTVSYTNARALSYLDPTSSQPRVTRTSPSASSLEELLE
ncbi:hypothetical protein FQN57_007344 [Myotisia sp. PD_48]|nr:hypothetical protein FQN57_007344 [Myotisia sp. PD_48]